MNLLQPIHDTSSAGDEELRERLDELLVADLYGRSIPAVAALLVVLLFLFPVLGPAVTEDRSVRAAVWALVVTVALRLAGLLATRRFGTGRLSPGQRTVIFAVGSTFVATAFAVINVVAIPRLEDARVALLAVCEAGIVTVAVVSMAASVRVYLAYLLPILASFELALVASTSSPLDVTLAALILVYIAALTAMSLWVHRSLRENILLRLRFSELATRDPLTGLLNRRALEERMHEATEALRRDRAAGRPRGVGLLLVDLDRFKEINDALGHAAGDLVLERVAAALRGVVRTPDLVARWGGEEFLVVAPDADPASLSSLAERVRRSISGIDPILASGVALVPTGSVGYVSHPFVPEQPEALSWREGLDLADAALRYAKRAGRNRSVGLAPGPSLGEDVRAARARGDEDLDGALAEGLVVAGVRGGGPGEQGVLTDAPIPSLIRPR